MASVRRHVKDLRCCVDQAPKCSENSDEDADLPLYVDVHNGCPLIIETDFDIAFNKFIAVGSS